MPDWKPTACILCECNCGLEVQLGGELDRHLVKLRGDKRHPSSQGYACEKELVVAAVDIADDQGSHDTWDRR